MPKRFYPAVLERGAKKTFAVWFPDFPDCVAAGRSQDEAIERAERALAQQADTFAESDAPLPEPTPIEQIVVPKQSDFVAFLALGLEPPNPSERVNIYLPKNLLQRADKRAAELGMSRSSFFGFAIASLLGWSGAGLPAIGRTPSRAWQPGTPVTLQSKSKRRTK